MGSICDSIPTANSSTTVMSSIPPFLSKTYDMVDDQSTNDVVSWSIGNNSFVVWDVPEFAKRFLPKYFKHNNFSSFVRQLNTYGFRKVDPDRWEFANEGFLRGQKQKLKTINRRKPSQVQPPQQPQVQHSSVGACTEVGKFGLEEEVERLQRDKNVLMQELVRLRQQQQVTEHHLQNVGQKVHIMEQRQQQMMSFLAKAVQSPSFLNQFSQQQQQQQHNNDNNGNNNRNISESNKKRRLSVEEEKQKSNNNGFNRQQQIVKYQEAYNHHHDGSFHLGDVSDNGSSSNGVSGVTLADVSSDPLQTYPAMNVLNDPLVAAAVSPNSDNGECLDPIMAVLDGSIELEVANDVINELLLPEDSVADDVIKELLLPEDSVWEQFFAENQLIGDRDELISGSVQNDAALMEQLELQSELRNVWNKNQQQMNHLTQQMGLLRSDPILPK